jgi:hypothetical protein
MKKTIKDYRIAAVLAKQTTYKGVQMSRSELMQKLKQEGATIVPTQIRETAKEDKEREWLKRNAFNHPFGNECHPMTIDYNNRKKALEAGLFSTVYVINLPCSQLHNVIVTKTEYDCFLTLG